MSRFYLSVVISIFYFMPSCKPRLAEPTALSLDLKFSGSQTYREKIASLGFVRDYELAINSLTADKEIKDGQNSEEYFIQPTLRIKHAADVGWTGESASTAYFEIPAKKLKIMGNYKLKAGESLQGDAISGMRSVLISKAEITDYVAEIVIAKNISPADILFSIEVALFRVMPEGAAAAWIDSSGSDDYSVAAVPARTIAFKPAQLSLRPL